ncbi:MAG TPA: protein kinase [Gemmataceae bacterium]
MIPVTADHPSWEELLAYGQGRLDPPSAQTLEDHLADCARCCDFLETAPGDSFLSRLREADASGTRTLDWPIPLELIDHPRYRVLGVIGQGGMGTVYRAMHRRMDRVVALKVIRPSLMRHPTAVQRFQQEARAAARLHHPHIVTAYDADQAGGLHFLVMEHVEGCNLVDCLREKGPLPVAEACLYARQAALGLQHAHEQGMVHRDIKPHNLMLQKTGEPSGGIVKILDFGLARVPRSAESPPVDGLSSASLTGTGMVMGTADYMAPEQAADPRAADIRADIYALGCTLFHLLCGRPPFPEGTVAEKLARHSEKPLPLLTALCPEAPPELAAVLERMTAKDPAQRYATPAETAEALTPFCPTGEGRPPLARKRRRWLVAALALSAAALFAGLLVWRLPNDRVANNPPRDNDPQAIIETPSPVDDETTAPVVERTEEEAIRILQQLGGRITRNDLLSGTPLTVDLSHTKVTDIDLPTLAFVKSLRTLKLENTKVTDAGMRHVAAVTQLQSLNLLHTSVGDAGIKQLSSLRQLHSLLLYGPQVTDAAMSDVARLERLSLLHLNTTAVTDRGLSDLTGLRSLNNLELNLSRGVSDEGMKSVAQFKLLGALYLSGIRVTDRGLKELIGLKHLTTLGLGGTRVTNAGMQYLAGMKGLRMLTLANTEVTDDGLKEVAKHRRLILLDLQGLDGVTDAGMKELLDLPELKRLFLARTRVTDAGLAELRKARPNLHILP